MSLNVLEPGLFSLPVDFGRTGQRSLGVPLGGAADRFSLALGNALLGNPIDAVGLEMTLRGPTLRAEKLVCAVIVGARFDLSLDGGPALEVGTTFQLEAGQVVRIGGTAAGCRGYLCVAGGFDLPIILGSRSAFEPLRIGDVLPCRASEGGPGGSGFGLGLGAEAAVRAAAVRAAAGGPWSLRVLPGPQARWFPDTAGFYHNAYVVSGTSNRMGVRLAGAPISRLPGELVSEAVAPGAVQITNDGLPVVLGVDGQTIGGYPKIAHVIRADLDLLGRLRPGDVVRFECVSEDEAEEAAHLEAQILERWLLRIQTRRLV